MWRHFAGRDFPLEGFCERLFPAEEFELGGISPHSQCKQSFPKEIKYWTGPKTANFKHSKEGIS